MSTINPPTDAASANMGLKIALTVFSTLSLAVSGTSIGFMLGYKTEGIFFVAGLGEILSIISNAAMIYFTCRLFFLVMDLKFPNEASLQDLHQCVARLVAFTILGFTTWVNSLIWLADKPEDTVTIVYHACNYGFVLSSVVAGLAGGLLRDTAMSTVLPVKVESNAQYTNPAYEHLNPEQSTSTDGKL